METTLRILLADPHEVVRVGLRALVEQQPGMKVVGEASTTQEAVLQAERLAPDLIVVDAQLPGLEACRELKACWPQSKVIILAALLNYESLFDAITAGADGYALKQTDAADLAETLRRVAYGETLQDPSVADRALVGLREARQQDRAAAFSTLTTQEIQILAHVAEGQSSREIGEALYLSENTVRHYVSEILGKLQLSSRAQAAAYAIRNRIRDYL
ncbi:MAG: response regulator transcription factor [Chloroflexi bacterium]|nr:response regulator transcription factor [Chloroflexota bacterium]MBU1751382.1 response regulator transcription factor [Chloroflexota bacterium]MBU1879565.1 response regulator transcription factor [Chloroflexota bacterium]